MGFGSFETICERASVPLCTLIGPYDGSAKTAGIEALCYARSIEFANTIIFQAAAGVAQILALIMTSIMIIHVRSKFTAVGRKEILTFFYFYMILTAASLVLDSGVVPPGSVPYPYFVAFQSGIANATCWCLLVNGFVGFQIYEDGTKLSVWLLRGTSAIIFAISFAVAICTFQSWATLSPDKTIALFIVLYLFNGLCLVVYIVLQIILVVNTLEDRWPLGDIIFGIIFLAIGQVFLYVLNKNICDQVKHYFDGLFLATVCNLLAVMMVYKYWDSITKEDLEFSVGQKTNVWEVKELLTDMDDRRTTFHEAQSDYAPSTYHGNRLSGYGYY